MKLLISLTQQEERTLDDLITLWESYGLDHSLFVTNNRNFLDKNEYIIQNVFRYNGILEWHPEGCGSVKFRFTELGFGLINTARPEFATKLKPFLKKNTPYINLDYVPKVIFKRTKEKAAK